MIYTHTQVGYLIIFVFFVIAFYFGSLFTYADLNRETIFIMALILFILVSFSTLNVTINRKHLQIKFGYGIFRKRLMLEEIVSARTVRNHWYHGWGIRFWWWPRMTIFNVSGFDAVELKMKNGKIYRVGTDEPEKLNNAITQVIKLSGF